MTGLRARACAVFFASIVATSAAAERLPDWVPSPDPALQPEAPDVPAVVLLRDVEITADPSGRIQTRMRVALRCFTAGCGDFASAHVPYLRGTQAVSDLRIVLASPEGAVRVIGKKDVIDAALDTDDLYDESRVAVLSAGRDVGPGFVVALEWMRSDSVGFPQHLVSLQDRLPVLRARCSVLLPAGWAVDAITFNHPPLEPRVAGPRTTWETSALPYRPDEPLAPPPDLTAPRIALTIRPAAGLQGATPPFGSWDDVGRWTSSLFDPASMPDDSVTARARELTSNAAGPRERFEAVARFVQGLTYVSIQMDLGRGGGYRPHAAAETLRRGYGDCKDKATLLRSLLRASGIDARPVLVSARDSTAVRREFPAAFWFDHVIVGVAGIEKRNGEPVVDAQGVGALLLFDPTDPFTPPGELPEALWDGLGLVAAPGSGALVRVPAGVARLERVVTGELGSDGSFRTKLSETGTGSSGESLRSLGRSATPEEVQKAVERWIARSLPGARVEGVDLGLAGPGPSLSVRLSGKLPGWQDNGKVNVLRAALVPFRNLPSLSAPVRRSPIAFPRRMFLARYQLRLPPHYAVSELPPPVHLNRSFGRYDMTVEEIDGTLAVTQELQFSGQTLPVERFAEARDFVQGILSSRSASLLLKRAW